MSNSALIIESALYQEPELIKQGSSKAIFRMLLQDCDTKNQNNRIYPKKVLAEAMTECSERMRRRAFLCELDHPLITGNDEVDGMRQTTVQLSNASHVIRDFNFDGNKLVGELETLTTPSGRILFNLLRDKVGLGVSMRGMATLKKENGVNIVEGPLTIISYDAVSSPSHKAAVVNFEEMKFESMSMLKESKNVICVGGKCFLPDYMDKLIEKKIITFYDRWL